MRPKKLALYLSSFLFFLLGYLFHVEVLYFMFMVVVSVPVLAQLFAWWSVRGIKVSRVAPTRLNEDEQAQVQVEVVNHTHFPRFLLRVTDSLPVGLCDGQAPGLFLPGLEAGERAVLRYEIRPEIRGRYELGPLQVTSTDPAGIASKTAEVRDQQSVLVYPSFPRVRPCETVGSPSAPTHESWRALSAGRGTDLYQVRPYQPGDEFRRIHWKATARTQQIQVVETEHPRLSSLCLIIAFPRGSNAGSGKRSSLEYAVKVAAGLAWAVLEGGGQIRLICHADGKVQVAEVRHRDGMTEILERLALAGEGDLSQFASFLASLPPGSQPYERLVILAGSQTPGLEHLSGARGLRGRALMVYFDRASFAADEQSYSLFSRDGAQTRRSGLTVRANDDLRAAVTEVCDAL